jgi:hypothetical protein
MFLFSIPVLFCFFFQLYQINISNNIQILIKQLIDQHKRVYREINSLHKHDQQQANLTKQLTHTVEILV